MCLGKSLCNGGKRRAGQGAACREMAPCKPGYCFVHTIPIVYPLWVPKSAAAWPGRVVGMRACNGAGGYPGTGLQGSGHPSSLRAARMLFGGETKRVSSGLIGKTFKLPVVFWGYLRSRRTGLSRCLPFLSFSLMAYSSFPLPDSPIMGQQKNTGFVISVFF